MAAPTGFYPDGSPHPSRELRRRLALELCVLVALTALYLGFIPKRPPFVDLGMALIGMGLVGLLAKETSEVIWGQASAPEFERVRRCTTQMVGVTVPAALALLLFGVASAYWGHRHEPVLDILRAIGWRLFRPTFFAALAFYIPWALLQQVLFQFYLLGRLRALLPYASPLLLSLLNGILYGLVHVSSGDFLLTGLTMAGGVVWSYSYHRDRYVLPIALSHAVLGATYFYWGCDRDIIESLFKPLLAGSP